EIASTKLLGEAMPTSGGALDRSLPYSSADVPPGDEGARSIATAPAGSPTLARPSVASRSGWTYGLSDLSRLPSSPALIGRMRSARARLDICFRPLAPAAGILRRAWP